MVTPLGDDEIQRLLTALDGWRLVDGHLVREVACPPARGEQLIERVARAADAMDHHPVVDVSEGRVRFSVWSHSVDAITAKDLTLARRIDEVVRELPDG